VYNDEQKKAVDDLLKGNARVTHVTLKTEVSAVSSVDQLAPFVVSDQATATAIKSAVCRLDIHDLTAMRGKVIPAHVSIPDNENSIALASAYAEAELNDRDKKSGWWKSWIGWAIGLLGIALGVALGAWLT